MISSMHSPTCVLSQKIMQRHTFRAQEEKTSYSFPICTCYSFKQPHTGCFVYTKHTKNTHEGRKQIFTTIFSLQFNSSFIMGTGLL